MSANTGLVHLDVEDCPSLFLYGIRAPIIGPFRTRKPGSHPYAIKTQQKARNGSVLDMEVDHTVIKTVGSPQL